jgi:hypothetical protein
MRDQRSYEERAPSKAKALAFILAEHAAGRGIPDNKALASHMRWRHETSAENCKLGLVYDGYLGFERKFVKNRIVRTFWLINKADQ